MKIASKLPQVETPIGLIPIIASNGSGNTTANGIESNTRRWISLAYIWSRLRNNQVPRYHFGKKIKI